jgi:hypothetical protein
MKVYKLDSEGNFLNEHNCQRCPETGGFLYPENYTEIDPRIELPIKEYKTLRFKNNTWTVEKFKTVYNKETKDKKIIGEFETIESDWTDKKPRWVLYEEWDGSNWINLDEDGLLAERDEENRKVKSELSQLDLKSIRDIREWIASQSDCPENLSTIESTVIEKRKKIK